MVNQKNEIIPNIWLYVKIIHTVGHKIYNSIAPKKAVG